MSVAWTLRNRARSSAGVRQEGRRPGALPVVASVARAPGSVSVTARDFRCDLYMRAAIRVSVRRMAERPAPCRLRRVGPSSGTYPYQISGQRGVFTLVFGTFRSCCPLPALPGAGVLSQMWLQGTPLTRDI